MQGWLEKKDPASGRSYYINETTRETTWQRPAPTTVAGVKWEEEVDGAWVPLGDDISGQLEAQFILGRSDTRIPVGPGDDVDLNLMRLARRDEADVQYHHIDPHGKAIAFSDADNALIVAARKRHDHKVKIGDVKLPSGQVLHFEVRFGLEAKSQKVPVPHKCGMVQVNLGSQNTRQVKITSRSGKKPTVHNIRRDPAAAARFFCVDPKTNEHVPYSDKDNRAIAMTRQMGGPSVRVDDKVINGKNVEFEVRFGDAAVSAMSATPSVTGMAQVNLANDHLRLVTDTLKKITIKPVTQELSKGIKLIITTHPEYTKYSLVVSKSTPAQALTLSFAGSDNCTLDTSDESVKDGVKGPMDVYWETLSGKTDVAILRKADPRKEWKKKHEASVMDARIPILREALKTKYDETLPKAAEAGDDIAKLKAVIADFEECLPMIEQLAEISPAGMKAGAGLQTAARITDALGSCKDRLAAAEEAAAAPPPAWDGPPPSGGDEAPPGWTPGAPPPVDSEAPPGFGAVEPEPEPADEAPVPEVFDLPDGWVQMYDDKEHRTYFSNVETGKALWSVEDVETAAKEEAEMKAAAAARKEAARKRQEEEQAQQIADEEKRKKYEEDMARRRAAKEEREAREKAEEEERRRIAAEKAEADRQAALQRAAEEAARKEAEAKEKVSSDHRTESSPAIVVCRISDVVVHRHGSRKRNARQRRKHASPRRSVRQTKQRRLPRRRKHVRMPRRSVRPRKRSARLKQRSSRQKRRRRPRPRRRKRKRRHGSVRQRRTRRRPARRR